MGGDPETERRFDLIRDHATALVGVRRLARSLRDDLGEVPPPADERVLARARGLVEAVLRMAPDGAQDSWPFGFYASAKFKDAAGHARQTVRDLVAEVGGTEGYEPDPAFTRARDLARRYDRDSALIRARDRAPRRVRTAFRSAERTSIALRQIKLDVSDVDLSELACDDAGLLVRFVWSRGTRWPPGISPRRLRARSFRPAGERRRWQVY